MNRKRSPKSVASQASVSNISSHVPHMTTTKNSQSYLSAQSLIDTHTTKDLQSPLHSISMNPKGESKRTRTICQPKGTIAYTTGDNDTLEKVALRFNSTPSELLQLNKLNSRVVFPGQILFVPEEGSSDNSEQQQQQQPQLTKSSSSSALSSSASSKPKDGNASIPDTDRHLLNETSRPPVSVSLNQSHHDVGPIVWSINRQNDARPGRAQRLKSDTTTESEPTIKTIEERLSTQRDDNSKQVKALQQSLSIDENHELDEECLQRFIKVHVRLMTDDHQSVDGTLLVTPNAVMFDPDVLDPLVKTHGIDKYGLIIRMNCLAGISLHEDLVMYEHEGAVHDEEKRKMYHSTSVRNSLQDQNNIPLNTDEEQIHDLMIFLLDKIDKELNSSSTNDSCMLFDASSTVQHRLSKASLDNNIFDNNAFLPISDNENNLEDSLQLSNNSFQPSNDYKHSIGILSHEKNENYNRVPSEVSYVFDWKRFKRAVKVKKACQLENCVSLDQFNKRFNEIDKLLYEQQQSYVASHLIEVPYYLCVRTSMRMHDIPSLHPRPHKKSGEISIHNPYGQKRLEHEYWFTVPKEKIDHLYSFFLRWTPERESDPLIDDDNISQSSTDNQSKQNDKTPANQGFLLLANDDQESTDNYETENIPKMEQPKRQHYLRRQSTVLKEWEIINIDEIHRRNLKNTQLDAAGIPAPKLLQPSTLIDEEQSKQLLIELPIRLHGLDWFMTFSTEVNGFSLNQLYRRSFELDRDLPSLLIVKDVQQNIFGAFIPHKLMISDGFYGTGESFLFTFYPEFRVFNWSGLNTFYVKGDLNSLGFGSGDGTYGLWIDGDLYHGRTSSSKTFANEPLTSKEDFIIASVEVWTFID